MIFLFIVCGGILFLLRYVIVKLSYRRAIKEIKRNHVDGGFFFVYKRKVFLFDRNKDLNSLCRVALIESV